MSGWFKSYLAHAKHCVCFDYYIYSAHESAMGIENAGIKYLAYFLLD